MASSTLSDLHAGLPVLQDRAVSAILDAAAHLLGMEVVFVGAMSPESFTFARIRNTADTPTWDGLTEGSSWPRKDSMCDRLLAGAPPRTHDAAAEPMYADVPARRRLGITSYVGVPVRGSSGRVVGTLCGIDRRPIQVDDDELSVLADLGEALSAHLAETALQGVTIRRTTGGWQVAQHEEADLATAMTIADLLTPELTPPTRPGRGVNTDSSEVERLRVAVDQLEHALAARVVIEQAIGVLAERQRVTPRLAFEKLRGVARRTGRKVFALSQEVVASAADPTRALPPELTSGRSTPPAASTPAGASTPPAAPAPPAASTVVPGAPRPVPRPPQPRDLGPR